jgi:hypothetical protein
VSKKVKAVEAFKELAAKIPADAKCVQVLDAKTGKLKYKPIEELLDLDVIQVKKDGTPITMKKSPGRPQNVVVEPATRMAAEIMRMKTDTIATDPILKVAKANPEDPDVLHQIVLALGNEAASIGFERQQAERNGEKTSELSVRRISALKSLADTWLKRKDQITTRGIDMGSPAYRTLMKEVLKAFQESLTSAGARPELIETVFTKLGKIMNDGWEAEVKARIKIVV